MNKIIFNKNRTIIKILKNIFVFIIITFYSNIVISQTILNSNLYFINKYQLNPAYTGSEGSLYSFLNYRNTSSFVEGAPVFFSLSLHSPFFDNMGAGLRFSNTKEGLFNNTNAFIDYRYKVNFKAQQSISFGISAGLESNKMDYGLIIAENQAAIIDVASKNYVGTNFETSAGISYKFKNLDLGFSIPQLFENKNIIGLSYVTIANYNYQLKNNNIELKPSLLFVKNPKSLVLYDINLQTIWKKQYWLGISYKNRPGFVFSAGLSFINLNIGYAIEIGTEKYSNIFNQIHEISIAYNFKKKIKSPNDSLFVNNNLLIIKNTISIKKDSSAKSEKNITKSINNTDSTTIKSVENIIINKSENTDDINKTKFKETGNGVYILHNSVSDTNNFENQSVDSLVINSMLDDIENKKTNNLKENLDTLEYVEVGNGIYRIKNNKTNQYIDFKNDSISEEILNSVIFEEKSNKTQKKQATNKIQYTLKIHIDNSNQVILYEPKISEKIHPKINKEGKIDYYYGKYNNIEEAKKQIEILKKSGIKNAEIETINPNK
ncbi:MAG: PorP/SprF family type IX secretion system membrane protein [Bacteroidales bacterium]|nr:PorP/SprF family type IX secretion system membrane protein [Bacteroidales bacterium]